MKLSGWNRLWIVGSVAWWGLGAAYLIFQGVPSLTAPPQPPVPAACEGLKKQPDLHQWIGKDGKPLGPKPEYTACDWALLAAGEGEDARYFWERDWRDFAIRSAFIVVLPFALWLLMRVGLIVGLWVLRGFWPNFARPKPGDVDGR